MLVRLDESHGPQQLPFSRVITALERVEPRQTDHLRTERFVLSRCCDDGGAASSDGALGARDFINATPSATTATMIRIGSTNNRFIKSSGVKGWLATRVE